MIARLRGTTRAAPTLDARLGLYPIVVDVGGVGYLVLCSALTAGELEHGVAPETAMLIHTKVTENAIALYGFLSVEEHRLFEHLIDVDGVGPSTALSMLSAAGTVAHLVRLIADADAKKLTALPKVGKKTADALIEHLATKLRGELEGGLYG